MTKTELSLGRRITDVIDEYNNKTKDAANQIEIFEDAGTVLKSAATISGGWGDVNIDTGRNHIKDLELSLKRSAWNYLYKSLQLNQIFTAKDKKIFTQSMTDPAEFTMDNIRASFGDYIKDPRANILRGLAEVFCGLDPSYKSHDKVKIGVAGLPKRVILSGFNHYSSYGKDKIRDILNALATYQGKDLVKYQDLYDLVDAAKQEKIDIPNRGASLQIFKNGNGHMQFDPSTLKDINRALAEFYGDILPDTHEEKPEEHKQSTEISKDLQYYPTPKKVVDAMIREIYIKEGTKVLEPSCGCGRIMDAVRAAGGTVVGVEMDKSRVNECTKKGHRVFKGNFLDMEPQKIYDFVIMNPPFYGKHYAKHVKHAYKFLKEGGELVAILPITARYDHKLLEGRWQDLPVGSFSESGTNINTTIFRMWKR